jgi:succinoglycan biosynthesis transport protein ExoP
LSPVRYLRAFVRSWYLVVITVIAGGAGGYLVYTHSTAMYQSNVQLVVRQDPAAGGDDVSNQALAGARAQSLAQVASTQPAVQAAATQAGLPGALPSVLANASASNPFITISVFSTDPAVTKKVADAYVHTLARSSAKLLGPPSTAFTLTQLAPAALPAVPYSPNRLREVGLGLAVGIVLGVALALLREALDRTLHDGDELREITGLPVLGTVPKDLPKELLPAMSSPRSARTEAYRQIRTTLLNTSGRRLRTIAVTSASPGEGKTSVASNVAAVFSRAGHRVALIDADLRRPQVATFFGLNPPAGLTDVLAGDVALEEALVVMDEGRLAVLTSGRIPSNPSEALDSPSMDRVLEQLIAQYEYVFVDTPPVLPVTDAAVLAPKLDGVILVARIGYTTRERVARARSTIERVNAKILGVVPNQAGRGSDRDYRYPYRYSTGRKGDGATEGPEPIATEALQRPEGEISGPTGRHGSPNGHVDRPVEQLRPRGDVES